MKPFLKLKSSLFLLILLGINAAFLSHNAFRTFKYFDMGSHLDAAWRIYKGQIPFVDFLSYTGFVHFHLNALFFHIFGFGKNALLAHLIAISSIMILLVYFLTTRKSQSVYGWAAALLTMTTFYWPTPLPWMTQTAHFLGLGAVILLLFPQTKDSLWAGFGAGFLVMLALFTKINVGLAYAAILFPFFCFFGSGKQIAGFLLGSGLGLLFLFTVLMPDPQAAIGQILNYSQSQKQRVPSFFGKPLIWFYNFYWLFALIALFPAFFVGLPRKDYLLFFFGLWFVGIFTTFTSGAVYQTDVQVMGLYAGLGFMVLATYQQNERSAKLIQTCQTLLIIVCVALGLLYTMYSRELKAWSAAEIMYRKNQVVNPVGTYRIQSPPFTGWLSNPDQGRAVDSIVGYLKQYRAKEDSLLILTDLQIIYSLADIPSFKGIPWIWTIDLSPSPGEQMETVQNSFFRNPPTWIVTHRGRVAYITDIIPYLGLENEITKNYRIAFESGNYVLLKRV